jgi:hypothetical protein
VEDIGFKPNYTIKRKKCICQQEHPAVLVMLLFPTKRSCEAKARLLQTAV